VQWCYTAVQCSGVTLLCSAMVLHYCAVQWCYTIVQCSGVTLLCSVVVLHYCAVQCQQLSAQLLPVISGNYHLAAAALHCTARHCTALHCGETQSKCGRAGEEVAWRPPHPQLHRGGGGDTQLHAPCSMLHAPCYMLHASALHSFVLCVDLCNQ
jgi:hypothetical protein